MAATAAAVVVPVCVRGRATQDYALTSIQATIGLLAAALELVFGCMNNAFQICSSCSFKIRVLILAPIAAWPCVEAVV